MKYLALIALLVVMGGLANGASEPLPDMTKVQQIQQWNKDGSVTFKWKDYGVCPQGWRWVRTLSVSSAPALTGDAYQPPKNTNKCERAEAAKSPR